MALAPDSVLLSNGSLITFEILGPKYRAVVKDTAGETIYIGNYSFSIAKEVLVEEAILALYGSENVTIVESTLGKPASESTTAYWFYAGVIKTDEGKPYINSTVNVEFEDGRIEDIIVKANGEFNINFELIGENYILNEVQSRVIRLSIIPEEGKYQPIELTNFVETESQTVEVENDAKLYGLGTLTLIPPFQAQSKTLQDIEIINKTSPVKSVKELPFPQPSTPEAKASKRIRKFIFGLAKRLPKYILTLFAPFGITIASKVIEGVRGKALESLKVTCPPKEVLLTLIFLRNELTTILNNANKVITTTNNVITITQTSLSAINAILAVLKRIPYPVTGVPPLGLPPLTTGQINSITETINKLQFSIRTGQVGLSTIQALGNILAGLLASILELLNSLDVFIQKCAEEQDIPYNLINAELVAIQGSVESSYKGFTFDIKLENLENPQYPRRYAVAINTQGLIVLRSESSFTANPQTLIDQLKFIIDRDNLKPF